MRLIEKQQAFKKQNPAARQTRRGTKRSGGRGNNGAVMVLALVCTITAAVCLVLRVPQIIGGSQDDLATWAVGFVMPDGARAAMQGGGGEQTVSQPSGQESGASQQAAASVETPSEQQISAPASSSAEEVSSQEASSQETPASRPADSWDINECQIGASGTQYNNFYVRNSTGLDVDIGALLTAQPDVSIRKNGEPQVLIMHTHTCESYMEEDLGYYPADHPTRNTDDNYNVTRVGDAIAEKLESAGIGVVHDVTKHDSPAYNGSYDRAAVTIANNLAAYPSIQVVLDIHRDALGDSESGRTKPTFLVNGKKAAQIMIISGCDVDGSLGFPDWEYNLRLGLRIQQAAETRYPGMTRPLSFCEARYNMNLSHGSLLIEVGTDANTLDEAVYSGSLLGDVLVDVLNGLTVE